jgi:hypothetical protein
MAQYSISQMRTVVPMETARRLCALGARRGGVVATVAGHDEQSARMVAWAAPAGPKGTRPIGTFVVQWQQPAPNEATVGELSWLPPHDEDQLWLALEELAGSALPR